LFDPKGSAMHYRVADHGRVFSTRDRGSRVLADFVSVYERHDWSSIVLDFEGVRSMTPSFADEFVGELLVRSERGEMLMPALANLEPTPLRALERCAHVRGIGLPGLSGSV
jgi:STAS-like domain of unknown function (DUF4325)